MLQFDLNISLKGFSHPFNKNWLLSSWTSHKPPKMLCNWRCSCDILQNINHTKCNNHHIINWKAIIYAEESSTHWSLANGIGIHSNCSWMFVIDIWLSCLMCGFQPHHAKDGWIDTYKSSDHRYAWWEDQASNEQPVQRACHDVLLLLLE